MTPDQILSALDKYEAKLIDYQVLRADTSQSHPNPVAARQHLNWMIPQVREFVVEGALAKAERWLCFIQGVAWTLGWSDFTSGPSIDDFRDDNR
jgi:hypothetical protein